MLELNIVNSGNVTTTGVGLYGGGAGASMNGSGTTVGFFDRFSEFEYMVDIETSSGVLDFGEFVPYAPTQTFFDTIWRPNELFTGDVPGQTPTVEEWIVHLINPDTFPNTADFSGDDQTTVYESGVVGNWGPAAYWSRTAEGLYIPAGTYDPPDVENNIWLMRFDETGITNVVSDSPSGWIWDEGVAYVGWSFDVTPDGAVWYLDGADVHRVLGFNDVIISDADSTRNIAALPNNNLIYVDDNDVIWELSPDGNREVNTSPGAAVLTDVNSDWHITHDPTCSIYFTHVRGSTFEFPPFYVVRSGDAITEIPPLRQRQRNDDFNAPRVFGSGSSVPTSIQGSIRRGGNTYL